MARHTLDLNPLLRALGIKGPQVPEFVPAIQATVQVADLSPLVNPFPAPSGVGGFVITPLTAEYSGVKLRALARGGARIHQAEGYGATGNGFWGISQADPCPDWNTPIAIEPATVEAPEFKAWGGTCATAVTVPNFIQNQTTTWAIQATRHQDDLVIPAGWYFFMGMSTANTLLLGGLHASDVPAFPLQP